MPPTCSIHLLDTCPGGLGPSPPVAPCLVTDLQTKHAHLVTFSEGNKHPRPHCCFFFSITGTQTERGQPGCSDLEGGGRALGCRGAPLSLKPTHPGGSHG